MEFWLQEELENLTEEFNAFFDPTLLSRIQHVKTLLDAARAEQVDEQTKRARDYLQKLPAEILCYIFSFIEMKDVKNVNLVCQHWKNIASDEYVWKDLCVKAFHPRSLNVDKYQHCWQRMFRDRNRLNELVAIEFQESSTHRDNNFPSVYNECKIPKLVWFQNEGEVRIYIDMRGESKHVPPRDWGDFHNSVQLKRKNMDTEKRIPHKDAKFFVLKEGHLKGYIAFRDAKFIPGFTYHFRFGDDAWSEVLVLEIAFCETLPAIFLGERPRGKSWFEEDQNPDTDDGRWDLLFSQLRRYRRPASNWGGQRFLSQEDYWRKDFWQELIHNSSYYPSLQM